MGIIFISLGDIPKSRIAGQMVTLCLTLQELPDCFPKSLHRFAFPRAEYDGSNISTFSTTLVITFLYDYSQSSERGMLLSLWCALHFPNH